MSLNHTITLERNIDRMHREFARFTYTEHIEGVFIKREAFDVGPHESYNQDSAIRWVGAKVGTYGAKLVLGYGVHHSMFASAES